MKGQNNVKSKKSYLIFISSIIFLAGGVFWFMGFEARNNICQTDYRWLNPNLACHPKPVISKVSYTLYRNKLGEEIKSMKKEGQIEEASVYFHDLENGPTFGINEREKFIPASLLKVPVMLTYFRLAEDDRGILKRTLVLKDNKDEIYQHIDPKKIIQPGKPYTVDELIFRMVAYSDNFAYEILFEYLYDISPVIDQIAETYQELGLFDQGDSIDDATLTVKNYGSIFRLLYNVSYLNEEFSEKALAYLSESDFMNGIRKNLPSELLIAHKYGERWIDDKKQLHDCGIIYFPGNPYLLCVMTRGNDFENMQKVIGKISKSIWDEVESRKL